MDDLESRALKLAKELSDFGAELRLACAYTAVDPASSLTKSRIVMERLLLDVYASEMGHEPRKPMLGEMLSDNQFTRKIERRILSRMNSIRDMGNLGPHGEAVEASDAARVLDDLCNILDWYVERNARTRPSPHAAAEIAPAAPQPESAARGTSGGTVSRKPATKVYLAAVVLAAALVIALVLVGPRLGLWHTGPPARDAKGLLGDLERLQGEWETVDVETDGQAVAKPLFSTLVIKGDKLNYFYEDGRPGNTFVFELHPNPRPKQWDQFTASSGTRTEGIYTLDGDTLKVCTVRDPRDPANTPRPQEFRTRAGANMLLITYKRKQG